MTLVGFSDFLIFHDVLESDGVHFPKSVAQALSYVLVLLIDQV
ncbi:Uncharacterised protein [Acinetobacter baumannii]|nr:Uncharacterised protein [Acinetobacter baumannii]